MRLPCLVGFVSIRSVNGGDFSDRIFVECRFRSHSKPLGSSTIRKPKWFYWFFFSLSLSLSKPFSTWFCGFEKKGRKNCIFFWLEQKWGTRGSMEGGRRKKKEDSALEPTKKKQFWEDSAMRCGKPNPRKKNDRWFLHFNDPLGFFFLPSFTEFPRVVSAEITGFSSRPGSGTTISQRKTRRDDSLPSFFFQWTLKGVPSFTEFLESSFFF